MMSPVRAGRAGARTYVVLAFGAILFSVVLWNFAAPRIRQLRQLSQEAQAWQGVAEEVNAKRKVVAAVKSTSDLAALLKDDNLIIRIFALEQLGTRGKDAVEAVPALIQALDGPDRNYVLNALEKIGPGKGDATAPLIRIMEEDSSSSDRAHAARLLARFGRPTESVAPLSRTLSDPKAVKDWQLRDAASQSLVAFGANSVPALLALIAHDNPAVQAAAFDALARIRPVPVEAIPTIREVGAKTKAEAKVAATYALWAMDPDKQATPETVREFHSAAKQPFADHKVKQRALDYLAEIRTADALNALIDLLATNKSDGHPVAYALSRHGSDAVPALIQVIESQSGQPVGSAASALGMIGKEAAPAAPALRKALAEHNRRIQEPSAAKTPQSGGSTQESAAQFMHCQLIAAIGSIGATAAEAIPEIEVALKDKRDPVAREAKRALQRIRESR